MPNNGWSQNGNAGVQQGWGGAGRWGGVDRGIAVIPNPKHKLLDQLQEVMRLKRRVEVEG
jgi:hypothetical protein